MSLTLDDWLKPEDGNGNLPDLGLTSAEEMKWVDLEFLDLATSLPTSFSSSNKSKSPFHFPDIFFDSSGGFYEKSFFIDYKDPDFDKGLLSELFPTSSESHLLEEDSRCQNELELEELLPIEKSVVSSEVTSDVLQIISKNFLESNENTINNNNKYEHSDENDDENKLFNSEKASKVPINNQVVRIASIKNASEEDCPPLGTVAKISILTDKVQNVTIISISGPDGFSEARSFQVNTSNYIHATELLKPLHLDRNSIFKNILCPNKSHKITQKSQAYIDLKIKDDSLLSSDTEELLIISEIENDSREKHTVLKTVKGEKFWVCPEDKCTKAFLNPIQLKAHLCNHSEVKPFKCNQKNCSWAFRTAFKLKRHMISHSKEKKYACHLHGCYQKFTTVYNLSAHLKLHERPKYFACQFCSLSFYTKRSLETHVKELHGNITIGQYSCPIREEENKGLCCRKFFTNRELQNHIKTHKDVKSHVCSYENCGKSFSKSSLLKAHNSVHTGFKPYPCEYDKCSWSFRTLSKLRRHERTHKNERNFVCSICSKGFIRAEHLRSHESSLHLKTLLCPHKTCVFKSTSLSTFISHLKKRSCQSDGRFRCVAELCRNATYDNVIELSNHLQNEHESLFGKSFDQSELLSVLFAQESSSIFINSVPSNKKSKRKQNILVKKEIHCYDVSSTHSTINFQDLA